MSLKEKIKHTKQMIVYTKGLTLRFERQLVELREQNKAKYLTDQCISKFNKRQRVKSKIHIGVISSELYQRVIKMLRESGYNIHPSTPTSIIMEQ